MKQNADPEIQLVEELAAAVRRSAGRSEAPTGEFKAVHDLLQEGRKSGRLGSEWMSLSNLTLEELTHFLGQAALGSANARFDPSALMHPHYVDDSAFSQVLRHNHSVDDPPLAANSVFGDVGPDLWGYIYNDPGHRRWLGLPTTQQPLPNTSWTSYKWSWIYAAATDPNLPDVTGGKTEVTARFSTDVEIAFTDVACAEVRSSAAEVWHGGFIKTLDVEGYFAARHDLEVRIDTHALPSALNPQLRFGDGHELWRTEFDPRYENGRRFTGSHSNSAVTLVVPFKGPTTLHVVEEITYTVDLTRGGLRCQSFYLPNTVTVGLYGSLEPLRWRLQPLCCG